MGQRRTGFQPAPWLLMLPGLVVFVGFFLVPMFNLFLSSFYRYDQAIGVIPAFTLENYWKFLRDTFYLRVLWRTVKVSLIVSFATLVIGYPVAYYLVQTTGRRRNYLTLLVLSPLLISMVVRTYGWVIILSNNGVINTALRALGYRGTLKLLYTELGMEIGLTHIFLSFMVLSIVGSLERIDSAVIRAAQSLGAPPLATFARVIVPLSLPGVLAGSVIVFSLASSAFVTPSILGGPQVRVMSYLTYEQDLILLNWPNGAAIAFILIGMTATLLVLYSRLLERGRFGVVFK